MKNHFSLKIQDPCGENFNQFKTTSSGGYCSSCNKEVIDFTKMNAREIEAYFKNNEEGSTCGRFNEVQLNRYSSESNKQRKLGFYYNIGLACLSLFTIGSIQAQNPKQLKKEIENNPSNIKKDENGIKVKGNITDGTYPLPGVTIMLEGTTTTAHSDFDGNFKFPIDLVKGDVLIFSYLGMKSQKITISNARSASKIQLQVDMKMDSCILMGKVAVKKVYKSK